MELLICTVITVNGIGATKAIVAGLIMMVSQLWKCVLHVEVG